MGPEYFLRNKLHNFAGIRKTYQEELDNLTLTTQPFRTLKFFILYVVQYVKSSISYLLEKGGCLLLLSTVVLSLGIFLMTIDGPHEKVCFFVDHHRHFTCLFRVVFISINILLLIGC